MVDLNRAIAVAMADGPEQGLSLLDALEARGELTDYRLLAAARADLLRRAGRFKEAATSYRRAISLGGNEAESGSTRSHCSDERDRHRHFLASLKVGR